MSTHHLVKAQLPNHQRTTVNITTGMTIKDALEKALKMRKLEPDMCSVFRLSPNNQAKQQIDWDVEVSMLLGDEVVVETKDRLPLHTQLSHSFAKSYLTLSKCVFCSEILMTGIRCLTCGIVFHKNCSGSVPKLCEPPSDYYRYMRTRSRTSEEHKEPETAPVSNQDLDERWEISFNEIEKRACIGVGSFGTVYEGYYHGRVALKELKVTVPTPRQLLDFKNEVKLLKKIRHPNVLLFMGYILNPKLMIVTQLCKGMSLYKYLHLVNKRDITTSEIKSIALGVAEGMGYLHAKNIIHRDLKSSNIFITDEDDLTPKIGDFGLACFKTIGDGDDQIYVPTGTILWMPPEVIRMEPGTNPFTFQSDVYSYGILSYELLSGKLPYFDFKQKEALFYLIGLGDPENCPKLNLSVIGPDKPEGMKSLMLKCIQRTPSDRPLFDTIISELRKIRLSSISRSSSEPLRLNDLIAALMPDNVPHRIDRAVTKNVSDFSIDRNVV